ncbi:hypothetical protein AAMO2058_001137400 [Amorphochlora amoebiformis]|mmetsp:Transcript_2826/g.4283  ORF Transcript_2826/g.4283 Transcript_2826/m.4283 type:complete len:239 (-) Transcript_2826:126-842(-)
MILAGTIVVLCVAGVEGAVAAIGKPLAGRFGSFRQVKPPGVSVVFRHPVGLARRRALGDGARAPLGLQNPKVVLRLQKDNSRLKTSTNFALDPHLTFRTATIMAMPFYALMLFRPRWRRTKALMQNLYFLAPFSLLYAALLKQSWRPDFFQLLLPPDKNFTPTLDGVKILLSGDIGFVSAWVHLLVIDLFLARSIYLEAFDTHFITPFRHNVILAFMFGPIGLLSHALTPKLVAMFKR